MKPSTILSCLFILVSTTTAFSADTLRFYNPKSRLVYYHDPGIVAQATRFEAPKPLDISAITIALGGEIDHGCVTLHIYGSEGGLPVPLLEKDLIRPIRLGKSRTGVERITQALKSPVHITSRQFFIVIDSVDPGVLLLSDSQRKRPACINGIEEFHHQFLKLSNGQWRSGIYAFAIDAAVEYTVKDPKGGFRDVTAATGIDDSLRSNASIAWADVDNDARLDLLIDGRLYHNVGDGTFHEITKESGMSGAPRANAFIDIDNDGRPDILFLGSQDSSGTSLLFRNNGDGTFTKSILGLPRIDNPTSFSIADANGDGYLDLFVGQMSLHSKDTLKNYLLLNDRQKGFVDRSSLLSTDSLQPSMSAGSQWIDYDNDGHLDLFLVGYNGKDRLWRNLGDTAFRSIAGAFANTITNAHGVGCDWADYDNDGAIDLLLPQSVTPKALLAADKRGDGGSTILSNGGAPGYEMEDHDAGGAIDYVDQHAGGTWGDADNDGLLDALITTSCDCRYAALYHQRPDHQFEDRTTESGLRNVVIGPDAVWVDYDNDGRLDIATTTNGRFRLYRNTGIGENNYVELDLSGQSVGSTVTVYSGNGKVTKQVTSGRGLLMQPPLRLHFGLGGATRIDSVVVRGEQSHMETYTNIAIGGITRVSSMASAEIASTKDVQLQVSPNPFTTVLHFTYTLSKPSDVQLAIYTIEGRKVAALADGKQNDGVHEILWDGKDDEGAKAPQGAYIYRFSAGNTKKVGNAILTR